MNRSIDLAVSSDQLLLEVVHLRKYFEIRQGLFKRVVGYVKAVDDVTFGVYEGETLGLVGESGCGKTTTARAILRAIEPSSGTVRFRRGETMVDIGSLGPEELRSLRCEMQLIFQDPSSSLNPRMTVSDIIGEPLVVHNVARGSELSDRVIGLMKLVGLRPEHARRYPHAFSGGQRQRIGIARALALNPRLIICDEPVSALDMSVQAQILNLLLDLQADFGLTYVFISHDLSAIRYVCDRIAVMYMGRIVEIASNDELFECPGHPYTEALLSAIPKADPKRVSTQTVLPGEVGDPSNPPTGCAFHPRCTHVRDICKSQIPTLRHEAFPEHGTHEVACHFSESLSLRGVS